MKAVDTNVLARFLVNDDPVQSPLATAALAMPTYVSDTVLLETAWLLSSRYRIGRADLAAALADLLNLPTVTVSDPVSIAWAIDRFARGADLADMLHLLSSRSVAVFVSLEKGLARDAGPTPPMAIEHLA